ncbi:MAG: DNA gyrase subunit A [Hyphomicrobiales bacterium]|nr:DNA gyrase subunit A [Hyphomicrobiales bacterium]
MRSSYLDYAMSVIVSRALPDARDGLKPVHRRILYAMKESGSEYNRPYRKSARIVGEVMGKYHPHGDSAIYDALVRMAQNFSLRLPLVDGQGNFGSIDGDSPAAMRYTESRLAKASHMLLEDIDKDTVDWQDNYDGSEREPIVVPARFPNLLVNGAGGIAVGMATNIPTYNLGEVIDGTIRVLENPDLSPEELIEVIPGPDFPTGGIIMGRSGIHSSTTTGRGSILIRGRAEVVLANDGKESIIITEIPYQVNKARMVERIAELVKEKRIEGITDLRDESDKSGIRVVVELRRDVTGDVILNQLYKFTPLQTSFGVNMLALDRGRPRLMNIKEVLDGFVEFRREVITRRTNFLLNKARDRAHILLGLYIAVANIDEVIAIIRSAPDPNVARERLMERDWNAADVASLIALVDDSGNILKKDRVYFTETQAKAILEMRLSRLTGLEQQKITDELEELAANIRDYLDILGSSERLDGILKQELLEIKEEFATPRRTEISDAEFEQDVEDLIQKEDMVVTVTMGGYIKRVPLSTYRAQRRGGKGRSGMAVRDEDITTQVFISNTHTPMLFFSTAGKVYKLKVYRLPLGNPQSRGRSLMNIFPLIEGETINMVMALPEDETAWETMDIMFATTSGNVRRNKLTDFQNIQSNGKIAMKLEESDALVGVSVCSEDQHVLLASAQGQALRCPVTAVRVFKGRNSVGVRGMKLAKGDTVISMSIISGFGEGEDTETRTNYLRIPVEQRRAVACAEEDEALQEALSTIEDSPLDKETITAWAKNEQFLLAITENGYGKRTSAYEYRITNRGGKGVTNILTSERNGLVVSTFPVESGDQIMLITNRGKLIRTPIRDVRITSRNTQGVKLFTVNDDEKVVSSAYIAESEAEDEQDENLEKSANSEAENNAESSEDTPDDSEE